MPLRMVEEINHPRGEPDTTNPQVFCDWCGGRIESVSNGNYEWKVNLETREPVDGQIYFTHKQCCRDFEEAHGGRVSWASIGLGALLVYLPRNLGLSVPGDLGLRPSKRLDPMAPSKV